MSIKMTMTMRLVRLWESATTIADLGEPHQDSLTATWCVNVWCVGHNLWACDTENGDDTVNLCRRDVTDDDGDIVDLWTGHVSGLAAAIARASV